MLLRKQQSYQGRFQADMSFRPRRPGYEAGVVVWWSQFAYGTVGVTMIELPNGEEVRTVVCRKPTGKAGDMIVSR